MSNPRTVLGAAAAVLATMVLGTTVPAAAQFFDTRSIAMGGTVLRHARGTLVRVNPAYRAVPAARIEPRWRVALPLGLVQNLDDFPHFDPSHEDLDLTAITRYSLNIPWAWQFRWQKPLSEELILQRTQNELRMDAGQARELLTTRSFDLGAMNPLLDLGYELNLGRRHGVVYVGLTGFAQNEASATLDDALSSVLSGAPVVDGTAYAASGSSVLQTGVTLGATYAREIPLSQGSEPGPSDASEGTGTWSSDLWERQDERPRLWVGGGPRVYLGLAYAGIESAARLTGRQPGPGGTDPAFAVDYEALYTTAGLLQDLGTAFGVELGAVLRWRRIELGAGVADLFADMRYDHARIDRFFLDPATLQTQRERIDGSAEATVDIPTSWLVDARYRWADTLLAGDVGGGPGGTSLHGGIERWVVRWLALRAGVERDTRGAWQGAGGVGLMHRRVGLDLAVRTHSRNLDEDRGVELAAGVVVGH